jgi:hypothetical protein
MKPTSMPTPLSIPLLPIPLLRAAVPCIAAALLACACDRAIPPGPPTDDPSVAPKTPGDAPRTGASTPAAPAPTRLALAPPPGPPSDAQITSHVAAALRDDPVLAGTDLSVHTDHGVVSVTGTVRSPEQVAEAEARAQAPTGVMRVDTRLSMAPP